MKIMANTLFIFSDAKIDVSD